MKKKRKKRKKGRRRKMMIKCGVTNYGPGTVVTKERTTSGPELSQPDPNNPETISGKATVRKRKKGKKKNDNE